MTQRSPTQILAALARQRILVIGDVFLDEYVFGHATRLSREAPIPVLEFDRRTYIPGGAANPANNIAALGAAAMQAAVVGDDAEGQQLIDLLRGAGVDPGCILTDANRPTTVKTRIISESSLRFSQQLARIDRIDRNPIGESIGAALIERLSERMPQIDAVLCSDYISGLLTPPLVQQIVTLCAEHRVLLTVDAQGELAKYSGASLIRCNNDEAAAYLGRKITSEDEYRRALDELLELLKPELMIVTRGRDGLSIQGRRQPYQHIRAHRVEAADTTGAGDTFIAVMTLALAADIDPLTAANLANYAAGLVVRRIGNAVVTPDELVQGIAHETD
ncbi:MAG: bifunctional hydroxymethylpyrimidine kinase/phosphomethylpyrimidine kinase [Chloroflexi bacterium]|nr:bifunctional hydroxymethylpyrimidine kinase/phosphomethylpyrimidine kinase [Chloroflexota bacterium]